MQEPQTPKYKKLDKSAKSRVLGETLAYFNASAPSDPDSADDAKELGVVSASEPDFDSSVELVAESEPNKSI